MLAIEKSSKAAFDELAPTYDAAFTESKVGKALRQMVWARLDPLFRRSHRVIELGCGTGEDAVRLARSGVKVVAIDPSAEMIRIAERKASAALCQKCVVFRCMGMEDLGSLAEGERFDGVLSNFGAVNCVPDLREMIAELARRLNAGAPLLWVVMGRHVPWEWFWHLSRFQWRKAWRRLRPGGVEWRDLTISYPTPSQIRTLLQPYFSVTRVAPLGFVLPPSYAAAWLDRAPWAFQMLSRLESRAHRSAALASWSDHFIVEAIRLPS